GLLGHFWRLGCRLRGTGHFGAGRLDRAFRRAELLQAGRARELRQRPAGATCGFLQLLSGRHGDAELDQPVVDLGELADEAALDLAVAFLTGGFRLIAMVIDATGAR